MKVRLLDIYTILSEYCDVDYTWETQEIDKMGIIIRDKLFIMHIKRNGVQAQTNNIWISFMWIEYHAIAEILLMLGLNTNQSLCELLNMYCL